MALGVESIPGGFRKAMSEKRDDLGRRKREPGIEGQGGNQVRDQKCRQERHLTKTNNRDSGDCCLPTNFIVSAASPALLASEMSEI